MNKLKNYLKNYFQKKSRLSKYSDILFILLIIGMLIPGPRREILTFIKKVTLFQPRIDNEAEYQLQPEEYNWEFMDLEGNIQNFSQFKVKLFS
jgi:hypothetical protein